MKKTKKNSFTNALGEELLNRKTFDKAKNVEDEIFLSETAPEFETNFIKYVEEPETPPVKPKTKIKTSKKSKPKSKKIQPEKIQVAENKDFEKRVFAEAENDFYEEKSPQNIGRNMRTQVTEESSGQAAFRNKILKKQFEDLKDDNAKDLPPDYDPELYRKLSRAELAGLGISIITMFYSFIHLDKPLFFLAASLFTHLIRPLVGGMCGKYNRAVQNGLRSFSLTLFVGALILLFMNS